MNNSSFICEFCDKLCKNKNSLAQHSIRCPKNPNKINNVNEGFNNKGRVAWNKGTVGLYQHSEETKLKMKAISASAKEKLKSRPDYQDYRRKMSELAKQRELGGFHFRRGVYYNGVKLDSSYEVRVAESLDANNIEWQRCKRFRYIDNSSVEHYYTPDFYLPHYDIYLDPKNDYLIENGQLGIGYSDRDKINWVCEQNNIKVLILNKDQLEWEIIKTLIDKLV